MTLGDYECEDALACHIGARLRRIRRALNLSQSDVADALGLTFQQIQKYERGANRLSSGALYMLSRRFGVPVAEFFEGLPEAGPLDPESASAIRREAEFVHSLSGGRILRAWLRSPPGAREAMSRICEVIADQTTDVALARAAE